MYIYIYNILCIYLRLDKCQATTHGIFKQHIHSKKKWGLRRKELTNGAIVLIKTAKIFKQHAATSVCSCGFHLSLTAYVQGSQEEKSSRGNTAATDAATNFVRNNTSPATVCAVWYNMPSATTRPLQDDNYQTDEEWRKRESNAISLKNILSMYRVQHSYPPIARRNAGQTTQVTNRGKSFSHAGLFFTSVLRLPPPLPLKETRFARNSPREKSVDGQHPPSYAPHHAFQRF